MRFLCIALASLWLCLSAAAEQRYALIIGNEDYPAMIGSLSLPHEDAARIADALKDAGFPEENIVVIHDGTRTDIDLAVADLVSKLSAAGQDGIGFFYYSGHGGSAEANGVRHNYLIPARTPITGPAQLPILGVRIADLVDSLAAANAKAVFVVSDACRNTLPFTSSKGGVDDKGMVRVPGRSGLYIAFATADGATAPDDGAFSKALAKQIRRPGQTADRAFTLALREVSDGRPGYRLPFSVDNLRGDICFKSCGTDGEDAVWERFKALDLDDFYEMYLEMYPNGQHRAEAEAALSRTTPVAAPSPAQTSAAAPKYDQPGYFGFGNWSRQAEEIFLMAQPYSKTPEEETAQYEKACNMGHVVACSVYANRLEKGIGVDQDSVKARTLLQETCSNGLHKGCYTLGRQLQTGSGGPKDPEAARSKYHLACNTGGEGFACYALAAMMLKGEGGDKDVPAATELLSHLCQDNYSGQSCYVLGRVLHKPPPDDLENAEYVRDLYLRGCEYDYPESCYYAASMVYNGMGGPKDEVRAEELVQKACDGGHAKACEYLESNPAGAE